MPSSAENIASPTPHWWDAPAAAFDAWAAAQSDAVQDMSVLEQIAIYAGEAERG